MASSGPASRLPKMIAVIRAQIRPGVVTPMVTASLKKPLSHRFCISMPTSTPTTKASRKPMPMRVSVVANAPGTLPLCQSSPKVVNTALGPGSSVSSISRPEENSHRLRKNR